MPPTTTPAEDPSAGPSRNPNSQQLRLPKFTSIQPPQPAQRKKKRRKSGKSAAGSGGGDGAPDSDADESSGSNDDGGDDSDNDEDQAFWAASSAPQTPNIAEAASHIRRSLSVHGLHELSSMPPQQLRKSVGNKVWRPHDEAVKLPGDWERLAVHVLRGAIRAFNLAFGLRATLMLVLELIKGFRKRKLKGRDVSTAIFSAPNLRFGVMFGVWAGLYKSVHNSLRLITPLPASSQRRGAGAGELEKSSSSPEFSRSSLPAAPAAAAAAVDGSSSADHAAALSRASSASGTNTPRSGYAELAGKTDEEKAHVKAKQKRKAFMRDPRSKVWHAYLAGAVSALAVMVETEENRISLAQQLFVRGLEGSYNVAHAKKYVNIPHGAVLVFGLACGQIMWAWLNAPDTLPSSYSRWITSCSHVAPGATPVHRQIYYNKPVDTADVVKKWFPGGVLPSPIGTATDGVTPTYAAIAPTAGNRRGITSANATTLISWLRAAQRGEPGPYVPCSLVHPWEDSHAWSPIDRFVEVTRWILPVYMTLYFVPALFLRTGSFLKNPLRVVVRSLLGSLRSSSFLGVFVIIFQTIFCSAHSLHAVLERSPLFKAYTPTWVFRFLAGSSLHWLAGFATCGSLFVDHARRRAELAAYVLPKGMESAWSIARRRGWAPFVPGGDLLLTSVGMSLVMGTYARSPEHLSGLVRRIVYQFIGRN